MGPIKYHCVTILCVLLWNVDITGNATIKPNKYHCNNPMCATVEC